MFAAFLSLLPLILRLLGFAETAAKLLSAYEAKKKANYIANSPKTDQEWTNAAEKGDL